jgi:hypothetical protein
VAAAACSTTEGGAAAPLGYQGQLQPQGPRQFMDRGQLGVEPRFHPTHRDPAGASARSQIFLGQTLVLARALQRIDDVKLGFHF